MRQALLGLVAFLGTGKPYKARITNSTTVADFATGGANGSHVDAFNIYNDHSVSAVVNVWLSDGTTEGQILQATIASKATLNVLASLYPASEKQFYILGANWKLRVQTNAAYAGNVDATGFGGDF